MGSSSSRALSRLEQLYAIGESPFGAPPGANRPGLSAAEGEAHALVAGWMAEAGLAVESDAAGNLYGRLVGSDPQLPEVWTGSHLDTVPSGGRFDGALGVVAGLEAVESLEPGERTVAAVAFRDEEGVRFGGGCYGSRALCGLLEADELAKRDADGITVAEALAALGLGPPPPTGWLGARVACFVETHVEQGSRLLEAGVPLAVVTGIVGTSGTRVTFSGRRGHAGTTPMAGRSDALVAAADFVVGVHRLARDWPDVVATVGRLEVEPGAANVIPERVTLTVDARAFELPPALERIEGLAQESALRFRCSLETERLWLYDPATMADGPRAALLDAAREAGVAPLELESRAGHDAAVLAQAGVPTAMLFVRSGAGGVSHSPDEWTDEDDLELAVRALAGALATLAS